MALWFIAPSVPCKEALPSSPTTVSTANYVVATQSTHKRHSAYSIDLNRTLRNGRLSSYTMTRPPRDVGQPVVVRTRFLPRTGGQSTLPLNLLQLDSFFLRVWRSRGLKSHLSSIPKNPSKPKQKRFHARHMRGQRRGKSTPFR